MLIHSPERLAQFIQGQRKRLKLSQLQAGAKVGLKQGTLSKLETNPERTQLATLFRILSALGLEMQIVPKVKAKEQHIKTWPEEW